MQIKKYSQAGTFESSDILVLVEPVSEKTGRDIEIDSPVIRQFGKSMINDINKVLDRYEIDDIRLICKDKGALSTTICARIETAVLRAMEMQEGTL